MNFRGDSGVLGRFTKSLGYGTLECFLFMMYQTSTPRVTRPPTIPPAMAPTLRRGPLELLEVFVGSKLLVWVPVSPVDDGIAPTVSGSPEKMF